MPNENIQLHNDIALLASSGLVALPPALALELVHNAEVAQQLRTPTEMRVSVLNDIKHPTPDSKYWQAVREQDVQFTELVLLSFAYRKQLVLVERITREIAEATDDLNRMDAEIRLEEAQFGIARMLRTASHREREILEWSNIKAELAPMCNHTLEDVDAHQLEAFLVRFAAQRNLISGQEGIADRINIVGLDETVRRVNNGSSV
jgi:hypothetical protein